MKQYLELLNDVLTNGYETTDRTGTGTKATFGKQIKFNLNDGFPLVTTKKVYWKGVVHELLWFISGSTNIKYLVDNDVNIWNDWPYKRYKEINVKEPLSQEEFVNKIKTDNMFAHLWGNLGPVYGYQWRYWQNCHYEENIHKNDATIDQLQIAINTIKNNPDSRRIIVNAWKVEDLIDMALPPCHMFYQFNVRPNGLLDCQMYIRSWDTFLGGPFNIASYALLLILVAQVTNKIPNELTISSGNTHIYSNHYEQVKLQLTRTPYDLPKVTLDPTIKNIDDFKFEHIKLENYKYHPSIKGDIAV